MQNNRLEHLLLIDIETVPQQPGYAGLTPEWQQLWTDKVHKSLPEQQTPAGYYKERAGIMAEFAKVIVICIGYFIKEKDQWQLRIKSLSGDDEKQLLTDLLELLQQLYAGNAKWNFCGHNIREFDIPFLCRRLLINQLALPAYLDFQNLKPWEINVVDTFQYWRFGDYKNYTSLNLLAAALAVPSPKDDIDGSMVAGIYWEEKDLARIVRYCCKDVVTVGNIMMRFSNMPLLLPEQVILPE